MSVFNFDVITLFPKAFELINNLGVITKALDKKLIDVNLHDLREYGEGSYRQVDDKPYGGGAGMVLKPEPIYKAFDSIKKTSKCKTFAIFFVHFLYLFYLYCNAMRYFFSRIY